MQTVDGRASLWRGWDSVATPVHGQRTSAGDAPGLLGRYFPKVRSWLALGAPLELLSPLSALRVVYPLLALVLTAVGIATADTVRRLTALACVALVVGIWVALLRARSITVKAGQSLALVASAAVGPAIWAGQHGDGTALVAICALGVLLPVEIYTALFFGLRYTAAQQAFGGVVVLLALMPDHGLGHAAAVAIVTALTRAPATAAVALLTRTNRRLGSIDSDTGIPNGTGIADHLADSAGSPHVVASITLAGLGDAREALGYPVGTELLRRAVEDLGRVLPHDAIIGRVAGDELVVVMPANASVGIDPLSPSTDAVPAPVLAQARELAARVCRAIDAGTYLVGPIEVTLRAHVGLAVSPWHGLEVAELVRRASVAADRAVMLGQQASVFDSAHGSLTMADLALLADLRVAAEKGELWLAYQPQIAASSGAVVGVEALLRWTSPLHGAVSPGHFIPLAERTGLVDRLTEWVLEQTLDAQVRWRRQGIKVPVSVNLSARSLTRPDLSQLILDLLQVRDLPASALAVEVTETAATPDMLLAVNLLRPLHEFGVRVSIDDFGTGYTSLSVLPSLPLDEIKVDQQFVLRSPTSAADEAIVRSVRELAHRLGLTAVAEGVEDSTLDQQMTALGFDVLQGFHHAKPLPEEHLLSFLQLRRLVADDPGHDGIV